MANTERDASHSKPRETGHSQAYILAVFLSRAGSRSRLPVSRFRFAGQRRQSQASAAVNGGAPQGESTQPQLTPEQQKAMVDQAVAPLLATLKTSPDDFNTIVQVANLYYDGRQYPEAVKYYQLAVKSQPDECRCVNRSRDIDLVHGRRRRSHRRVSDRAEVSTRSSGNAVQPGRGSVAGQA